MKLLKVGFPQAPLAPENEVASDA